MAMYIKLKQIDDNECCYAIKFMIKAIVTK